MALSFLCLAHCLFLPVLITFIPTVGIGVFQDELFHRILVFGAALISLIAFVPGARVHKKIFVPILAAVGLLFLFGAVFYVEAYFGENAEKYLTFLGGSVLMLAHFLNRSFCRQCLKCRESITDSCALNLQRDIL